MSSDHYLRLLSRHLEAENAHMLPATLATLSADCVFDDMALGRRFETHEQAEPRRRLRRHQHGDIDWMMPPSPGGQLLTIVTSLGIEKATRREHDRNRDVPDGE